MVDTIVDSELIEFVDSLVVIESLNGNELKVSLDSDSFHIRCKSKYRGFPFLGVIKNKDSDTYKFIITILELHRNINRNFITNNLSIEESKELVIKIMEEVIKSD